MVSHRPISNSANHPYHTSHHHPTVTVMRFFIFVPFAFSFETPERSVFDESGLNYADHTTNQTDCTDLGSGGGLGGIVNSSNSGGASCLQLKAEPVGGPSSPESSSEPPCGPDDCAGCGRTIQVRATLPAINGMSLLGLSRANQPPFVSLQLRLIASFLFSSFVCSLCRTEHRIAFICQLLRNGGTRDVYSAAYADNSSNGKRLVSRAMAISIAKQIITGKFLRPR